MWLYKVSFCLPQFACLRHRGCSPTALPQYLSRLPWWLYIGEDWLIAKGCRMGSYIGGWWLLKCSVCCMWHFTGSISFHALLSILTMNHSPDFLESWNKSGIDNVSNLFSPTKKYGWQLTIDRGQPRNVGFTWQWSHLTILLFSFKIVKNMVTLFAVNWKRKSWCSWQGIGTHQR